MLVHLVRRLLVLLITASVSLATAQTPNRQLLPSKTPAATITRTITGGLKTEDSPEPSDHSVGCHTANGRLLRIQQKKTTAVN